MSLAGDPHWVATSLLSNGGTVVDSWRDNPGGPRPSDYAPQGLRESWRPSAFQQEGTRNPVSPYMTPGWQTGGRVGGVTNAWDDRLGDNFFGRARDQYEEEQRKIAQNPDYVSNLFLRGDYTGVVTWDQTFDVNGQSRQFNTGDIYEDGQLIGNVYDEGSGFSLEEANAFLAPMVLGPDQARAYRDSAGDQQKLRTLISERGAEEGKLVSAYETRRPYENAVQGYLDEWDERSIDEVVITGSGILGGAATGAAVGTFFGPVGTVVGAIGGGIIGGIGSWLNADEARAMGASTLAQMDVLRADEERGDAAAFGAAVQGIGGFAMSRLNVAGNLAGGINDSIWGVRGDNISNLQVQASEGNIGAYVTIGVTGVIDGALMAAGRVPLAAYMASMGGVVGGRTMNQVMYDGEWDETTGSFHRYETASQRLAGYGATLIDAGQMVLPGALRLTAQRGIGGKRAPHSTYDELMSTPGAQGRITVGDRAFDVRNVNGKLVADRESVGQTFIGMLAPSTLISRGSSRASAYAQVMREGRTSVTADDLFQAAVRMDQATVPWKMMLVNGFGESVEEVAQTVLGAHAVGWSAEPSELVTAAIGGFAMGAGMSVGARYGSSAADERARMQANFLNMKNGVDKQYTREEWRGMNHADKATQTLTTKFEKEQIKREAEKFRKEIEQDIIVSDPLMRVREDALKTHLTAERLRKLEGASVEGMHAIIPFSDTTKPSHHAYVSSQGLAELLNERLEGLSTEAQDAGRDGQQLQELQQIRDHLSRIIDQIAEFRAAAQDGSRTVTQTTNAINALLQNAWDSNDVTMRQAVELIFSRLPNDASGSFQMFLLQVAPEMDTLASEGLSTNRLMQVSQSYEKLLSQDNDGDQIKHQARHIVPDATTRTRLRLGENHWASTPGTTAPNERGKRGYINIAARGYEEAAITFLRSIQYGGTKTQRREIRHMWDGLVTELRTAFGDAVRAETWDTFRTMLDRDPQAAKNNLYADLTSDYASIMVLAEQGSETYPREAAPSLFVEDTFQRALETWRQGEAFRTQAEASTQERGAQELSRAGTASGTSRSTPAATYGQTAAQRGAGVDQLRHAQQAQYGSINHTSEDAEYFRHPNGLMRDIIDWYSRLTRLRPLSEIETIRQGGNPVIGQAMADLENLVQDSFPELTKGTPAFMAEMLRTARLPFWNVTEGQTQTFNISKHPQNTTMATMLIRSAAERLDPQGPLEFGELTLKQQYANMDDERAVILLAGRLPIQTASGLSNFEVGQLGQFATLRSLATDYAQLQSRYQRQMRLDQMKAAPSASDPNSLYSLIIESVESFAHKELSHARDGSGKATGRLPNRDRDFHEKTVKPIFESVKTLMATMGLGKSMSKQGVIDALTNNGQMYSRLMAMFPPEMVLSLHARPLETSNQNEFALPSWFYDMLLEQDSETAAMIYWRGMFKQSLQREYKNAHPGNTWVKLYQTLDSDGQKRFSDEMESATDVQSFVNLVNREFAYNLPPLMAWQTDTTITDPGSTKGGWQWSSPSAERRQALQEAYRYFSGESETFRHRHSLTTKNMSYAQRLVEARRNPYSQDGAGRSKAITRLEQMLAQGTTFIQPALGPLGMRAYVQRAFRGIGPKEAAKGVAGHATAQIGGVDARRNRSGFGSQLDQAFRSVLAGDVTDLSFNPQQLMQELNLQLADGATIEWTPLTVDQFLELMIADGGAWQNLVMSLINPSVYEENASGGVTRQFLFEQDFERLLNSSLYTEMIQGQASNSKYSPSQLDDLFLSYIDSLTEDHSVARMLAHTAVAYTTRSDHNGELSDSMYTAIAHDVAEAIRSMLSLIEGGETKLSVELNKLSLRALVPDGSAEALLIRAGKTDAIVEQRRQEVLTAKRLYDADPNEVSLIPYIEALQNLAQAEGLDITARFGEMQLQMTKIDWTDEAATNAQMTAIDRYIRANIASLQRTTVGEDANVIRKWSIGPRRKKQGTRFPIFGTEAENRAQWDRLSRVVALHMVLQRTDTMTSNRVRSPETDAWANFDPSFVYLAQPLFRPEFLNALQPLRDQFKSATPTRRSVEQVVQELDQGLLNRNKYGDFHPDLILQHDGADKYLSAAGSNEQIAAGGNVADNFVATTYSSKRTMEIPPAEMARQYSVDGRALIESELGTRMGTQPNGEAWAIFENAYIVSSQINQRTGEFAVAGPVATILDATGAVVEQRPLTRLGSRQGRHALTGRTAITPVQISHADLRQEAELVQSSIADQDGWSFTIDFQMYHPEDKPADPQWSNSVVFDGTVGPADSGESIYAELLASPDGITQRTQRAALDAIKGHLAIFTTDIPADRTELRPEELRSLIQSKTLAILGTPMGEGYYFPTGAYRGVYRMVRDHLVITAYRDGEKEVFSTEQWLTMDDAERASLERISVVALSTKTLETLRGATGRSGHPIALELAPLPGGEGETWTGSYSAGQLLRVPNLGERGDMSFREIMRAFRANGILDRETIQTLNLERRPTADSLRSARLREEQFQEERSTIANARALSENRPRVEQANETIFKLWLDALQARLSTRALTVELARDQAGDVPADTNFGMETTLAQVSELEQYMTSKGHRVYLLNPNPRRYPGDPDQGFLSSVARVQGQTYTKLKPIDDLVVFDLSNLEEAVGSEGWIEQVRSELRDMLALDLKVAFVHNTNAEATMLAQDLLLNLSTSYGPAENGLYFERKQLDTRGQTNYARAEMLRETRTFDVADYGLMFLSETGQYPTDASGLYGDFESVWHGRTTAESRDILPTTGIAGYHLPPSTAEAGQHILNQIKTLAQGNGADYLAEQIVRGSSKLTSTTPEMIEEMQVLLDRLVANFDPLTARPRVGSHFEVGDLLVLTDISDGSLTLVRWGYDPTNVDFSAQTDVDIYDRESPGIPRAGSIRIVAEDRLSSDDVTLRGGVVESIEEVEPSGLSILFRDRVTTYGAKMIDDAGYKFRHVQLPEKYKTSGPIIGDVTPGTFGNTKDLDSKGVTVEGGVIDAQEAISVYGWDPTRAYANAIGLKEVLPEDGGRWTRESWAALDADVREAISAQIQNHFAAYRRDPSVKFIADSRQLAEAVSRSAEVVTNDVATHQGLVRQMRDEGWSLASAELAADSISSGSINEQEAEQLLYSAALTYLTGVGTKVPDVMGAPGFSQPLARADRRSTEISPILSTAYDSNIELRTYIQRDINSRLENVIDANGRLESGWLVNSDWRLTNRRSDGYTATGVLRKFRATVTGSDHSERTELNALLATHDKTSDQQSRIAMTTLNLDTGYRVRSAETTRLLRSQEAAFTDALNEPVVPLPDTYTATREEVRYAEENRYKAQGYFKLLNQDAIQPKNQLEAENLEHAYQRIYDELELPKSGEFKIVVDSMIRVYYRSTSDPSKPEVDNLSVRQVTEALNVILADLKKKKWPSSSSAMPLMHPGVVEIIYRHGKWRPGDMEGAKGSVEIGMMRSAYTALKAATNIRMPRESMRELDALASAYSLYLNEDRMGPTLFDEIRAELLGFSGDFIQSLDPNTREQLARGENPFVEDPDRPFASGEGATHSEAVRHERRTRKRTESTAGYKQSTAAEIQARGHLAGDRISTTNEIWRTLHAIRTFTPQMNPLLWVWNPVDVAWRQAPAQIAGMLTGSSTSAMNRRLMMSVNTFSGKLDNRFNQLDPESQRGRLLQAFRDLTGMERPWIDNNALRRIPLVAKGMFSNRDFASMLQESARHRPDDALLTRGDRTRQKFVDTASRLQMSLRSLKPRDVHMYLQGILQWHRVNSPETTPDEILQNLHNNPMYYMEQSLDASGAHTMALNNVKNTRGAKLTALGSLVDKVLIPASESTNWLLSGPANTLLLLAKFRNFAFSSAVNAMGGQAVDASFSILLQAAEFKRAAIKRAQGDESVQVHNFLKDTFESADLADMVIRAGVSHTGLFMAALAMGSLGLTGEDEEERRRRRAEQLQGLGAFYNPLDIRNDFRNENTVWLEGLADTGNPLLAAIASWFEVETPDGVPSRSPLELHWTLDFFVRPILGMTEFMQTGDFRDLADGFMSAMGSMPLINTNFMWEAYTTAEKLYTAGASENFDNADDVARSVGFFIKAAATFERALFEFSFLNEIYVANDTYARNPWMMPKTNEFGQIDPDAQGNPQNTGVMVQSVDPETGNVIERPQTRDYIDGLLRSYTQNQATAGFIASLVSGFFGPNQGFGTGNSFWRQDMGIATQTIERDTLNMDDAEQLVMSIWDPYNNREVLSLEGEERLMASIMAGTLQASDPAVQNVFLTFEQREALSDRLLKNIFIEAVEVHGMDERAATEHMWEVWMGIPGKTEPLSDVVWSNGAYAGENGISWDPTVQYQQLNTTWAIGPDGKSWATGIPRTALLGDQGVIPLPFSAYPGSRGRAVIGNLDVDGVLNSTDPVMNLNTGFRGLTRVNNNIHIPDEQDIIDAINAATERVVESIDDLHGDLYSNDDYRRGFYYPGTSYGRGGGGGGGYSQQAFMPFINRMSNPYLDNIPSIYVNSINPRRSRVNRERFSSQRGRLNQQQ